MLRASLLTLFLLTASVLAAQTNVDAGIGFGLQSYESSGESPRALPSADLLARRGPFGVHLAVEVTDLPEIATMFAVHLDAVYRLGERYFFLAGAGPTSINTGSPDITWNAEVEVGRKFRRMEVYAGARHYDFSYTRFRDRPASPNGPVISAGVRFALRR